MKRVLFLTVLSVAGFSCASFAQFKLSLGPVLGMNYNFYHGTAIDNSNRSFNGAGLSAGGQVDMSFSPVLGLLVSVTAYDGLNAKGSLTQQGVKDVLSYTLSYLAVNPSLKFTVPNTGLGFFAGPGIGFNTKAKGEQYQVTNGQRQQLVPKTDLLNTNLRINGQIGMLYDFDLKGLYLSPFFLFDYGFNEVQQDIEYQASGIKFGLAIKFNVVKQGK